MRAGVASVDRTLGRYVEWARRQDTLSVLQCRRQHDCVRCADDTMSSDVQGTACLRIGVAQRGHANKSSAPRIRRRSRDHLAEAYAPDGPMKERLLEMAYSDGDRRCRMRPDHFYKLQAEAIRGCNLDEIARLLGTHVPPAAAFQTQACYCRRDTCTQYAWLAGSPAVANRPAEAALCLESHAASVRAFTIRRCRIWREPSAHTAGPYQDATNASLWLDGCDLFASSREHPTRRRPTPLPSTTARVLVVPGILAPAAHRYHCQ
jgi:hypothetical protein